MPCLSNDEIYAYLGGELSTTDAERVRKHLNTCEACAARLARFDDEHNDVLGHLRVAVNEQDTLPTGVAGADVPVSRDSAAPAESDTSLIQGYTILKELHRGGQGVVYHATQTSTKRMVAIKLLLEGQFASKAARRRFEREIELAASLKHPNIVAIFDSGQTSDGRQYFVMDYVRGEPLTQYARGRKLGVEKTLTLYAKVCDAIQYAHQRGVIHRDLKPGNILVDSDGEPRVLDFGLAKQVGSASDTLLSLTGQIVGTLAYMSPEQARGNPDEIDTRTDIYALGVILYEMLTGSTPYPAADAMAQIVKNILEAEPSRPSSHNRSLGDELDTMVLKLLSKEPARRYQSAGDVAADVRRFLAGDAIEAKRDSGWYVLRKTMRRHRVAIGTVAAFLLLLIGATIFSTAGWRQAAENQQQAQDALVALVRDGLRSWDHEEVTERAAAAGIDLRLKIEAGKDFFFVDPDQGDQIPKLAAFSKELFNWLQDSEAQALENLTLAETRAEQLKQVADFQSAMFFDLDAEVMGQSLRSLYASLVEEALRRRFPSPSEVDRRLADYESIVRGVNATDAAVRYLDETILSRAHASIDEQFANQPSVRAQLLGTIGSVYFELGLANQAKAPLTKALEIADSELGPDDPLTIEGQYWVGRVLGVLSDHAGAESMLRTCVGASRRVFGDGDVRTAQSLEAYAELLQAQGRFEEAEPFYREAVSIRESVSGDNAKDTLRSTLQLALLLEEKGDLETAEKLLQRIIDSGKQGKDESDADTIMLGRDSGILFVSLGKYDEAVDVLQDAVRHCRSALGNEHPTTLATLHDLAFAHRMKGDFATAERLYREALEGRRRVLGDDHPETLFSLNNMGGLLNALGRPQEAIPYFESTLEGLRAAYGPNHLLTLSTMNNLGVIHQQLGDDEQALGYYREALAGRRAALGNDHSKTLTTAGNLGFLLLAAGRIDEAEPLLREALDGRKKTLGEDHPLTVASMNYMGGLMKAKGELDEAEEWFRQALEKNRKMNGNSHLEIVRTLVNLSDVLNEKGQIAEAGSLLEDALRAAKIALPADHPMRGRVLVEYGWALLKDNRPTEAEPILLEAHSILADAGPGYEKYATTAAQGLVQIYLTTDRDAELEEWREKLPRPDEQSGNGKNKHPPKPTSQPAESQPSIESQPAADNQPATSSAD